MPNLWVIIHRDLHRVSSKLWWEQRFRAWFWVDASLKDSTALSTSRFLANWSGCFDWTDLHSGHNHSSWSLTICNRHAWQKLCPQASVIRIGGVNISFYAQNAHWLNHKLRSITKPCLSQKKTLSTGPKHIEQVKSSSFISLWKVRIRVLLQLKISIFILSQFGKSKQWIISSLKFVSYKDECCYREVLGFLAVKI